MRKCQGKIVCLLFMGIVLCGILPACTQSASTHAVEIVTTTFPAYDIARTLTKDCQGVRVRLLLSPGTESHSYDPSAADMMSVHDADLFLYIGQAADAWAETLIQAAGKNLNKFALTDDIELLRDDHQEADAHVWTDPENVISIVERLTPVLCALPAMSQENSEAITAAAMAYIQDLQKLDQDFQDFFQAIPESDRLLVFGDRFPFRYFAEAYDVSYMAAFHSCSHESEPSAGTVMTLIDTVRSRGISTIFYVELSQHRIADTIAAETGAKIALLHACHNVSQSEFEQGETYLSLMRKNLERLQDAFR